MADLEEINKELQRNRRETLRERCKKYQRLKNEEKAKQFQINQAMQISQSNT